MFAGKAEETAIRLPMGGPGALRKVDRAGGERYREWGEVSPQAKSRLQYLGKSGAQGAGDQC